MGRRLGLPVLLLTPLAVSACIVQPALDGKRCDDEHPCIDGFECLDGRCLSIEDGGDDDVVLGNGGEPGDFEDDAVFPDDGATLARLEFDGSGADASGNGNDAVLLDPDAAFAPTAFGKGLVLVDDLSPTGFDWNPPAAALTPPFTIEMVFTPSAIGGFQKIFGHRDDLEAGWYLEDGRVAYQPFVSNVGPPLAANERVYLTMSLRTADDVDVFLDGVLVNNVSLAVGVPPLEAHFFNDNADNLFSEDRSENLSGVLEAVRISSVARTPDEVALIQARLDANP